MADRQTITPQRMKQARGLAPADLVLKGAKLVNVLSGEIEETEIGIADSIFLGLGRFAGGEELDLGGAFVVPGLIDAHVHIESAMVEPQAFFAVLPAHGVTTAIVDPHEIANVLGAGGISHILEATENIPANCFLALPSCVPATAMETSGAKLASEDLMNFCGHPRVIALGEVMNVPAVLEAEGEMAAKLALPLGVRDGHAPGVAPQDLNAYFLAGISTDHECTTVEEVKARLQRGFYVLLREGSAAKNLRDLLPAVTDLNAHHFLLATDDRHPDDLLREGSIDHLIRLAIAAGQPPVRVIQMATINAARAYGLQHLGAVAPGYQADFLVVDSLENFRINAVYHKGRKVSASGRLAQLPPAMPAPGGMETGENSGVRNNSVRLGNWHREKLLLGVNKVGSDGESSLTAGYTKIEANVIGLRKNQLWTDWLREELPVEAGLVLPDPGRDIVKLAVVERHQASGRVGLGFLHGLGLAKGALATTVGHDSHNLLVAGTNDRDMDLAVRKCADMGGGLLVVADEEVLGSLPLPVAGLLSLESMPWVADRLSHLNQMARTLGVPVDIDPFMALSFLSLPVIPHLKLTDMGLVDVDRFALVNVVASSS